MKRLLLLAAVCLPSCTTPPVLVAPKPDFVPEALVPNPSGDVRAFRVDFEEVNRPEPKTRFTLSPLAFDERGFIPPQNPNPDLAKSSVLVRVYRPGYLTVELKPAEERRGPMWLRADPFEQEMAIDVLLGVQRRSGKAGWWELIAVAPRSELTNAGVPGDASASLGDYGLQPGGVAASHREVLLFAASEYARLAMVATEPDVRRRLNSKAAQIKGYADELTPELSRRRQLELNSR